jgi:hypothetical protein
VDDEMPRTPVAVLALDPHEVSHRFSHVWKM